MKTFMISYNYGGFAVAFIDATSIDGAIAELKRKTANSVEIIRHKLYAGDAQ